MLTLLHDLFLFFVNGFSTGCQNPPTGRALENLSSCVEAPHVVDTYIQRERQAGLVAGPFPKDFSGVKKISLFAYWGFRARRRQSSFCAHDCSLFYVAAGFLVYKVNRVNKVTRLQGLQG